MELYFIIAGLTIALSSAVFYHFGYRNGFDMALKTTYFVTDRLILDDDILNMLNNEEDFDEEDEDSSK